MVLTTIKSILFVAVIAQGSKATTSPFVVIDICTKKPVKARQQQQQQQPQQLYLPWLLGQYDNTRNQGKECLPILFLCGRSSCHSSGTCLGSLGSVTTQGTKVRNAYQFYSYVAVAATVVELVLAPLAV
jgi:hypothetical protein